MAEVGPHCSCREHGTSLSRAVLPLGSWKKRDTSLVPWAVFSIVERRRVPTLLRRVGCMVGWPRKYECDGSSRCLRSLLRGPLRACSVDSFPRLLSLTYYTYAKRRQCTVVGTRPHALTLEYIYTSLLHFSYCISLLSLFFDILSRCSRSFVLVFYARTSLRSTAL